MTEHLNNKHLLNAIADEDIRRELIARCALDDTDKKILTMRYVKHQDFGYIADTLGLSYPAVIKRHKKALVLIQSLARARVNSV
jgi:DNA-directed RNA polymerase specialized sigma subunit